MVPGSCGSRISRLSACRYFNLDSVVPVNFFQLRSFSPGLEGMAAMVWGDIECNWPSLMRRARRNWAELTEDDLCCIAGNQLQLIGRLQQRYCIARAEAERQVMEWAHGLRY